MSFDGYDIAAERLVLGALVRGSLDLRDEVRVEDLHPLHQDLVVLLLAALGCSAEGGRRRPGLDLAGMLRAGRRAGVEPLGGLFVASDGREVALGYLPTLARAAPRKRDAIEALRRVALAAEERRVDGAARERREQSREATCLRRALDAYLAGDAAAAMRAMSGAQKMIVGVSGPELAQLASGGGSW